MITISSSPGYRSTYICHVDAPNGKITDTKDREAVEKMRAIAGLHQERLIARGRNPNRKQFAQDKSHHDSLRRSIPLAMSSRIALYSSGGGSLNACRLVAYEASR